MKGSILFVGRFQPLHNGHYSVMEEALQRFPDHQLIIVLGSAQESLTKKNPWNQYERFNMVSGAFYARGQYKYSIPNFRIVAVDDNPTNHPAWAANILEMTKLHNPTKIIGYRKDESSFYLDLFPSLELIEVEPQRVMSATDVRKEYFTNQPTWNKDIPRSVAMYLEDWKMHKPDRFEQIASLYED